MNLKYFGGIPLSEATISTQEKWDYIKSCRDGELARSNWTQLPDARIAPAKKAEWDAYRELLSTIETRFALPDLVEFPNPPIDERTTNAPSEVNYSKPIHAPDFIVSSPKPKANHLEAHTEAIAESKKADKSLALIVLDLVIYIEELEKRLQRGKL